MVENSPGLTQMTQDESKKVLSADPVHPSPPFGRRDGGLVSLRHEEVSGSRKRKAADDGPTQTAYTVLRPPGQLFASVPLNPNI